MYDGVSLSRSKIFKYYSWFKNGRESLKKDLGK